VFRASHIPTELLSPRPGTGFIHVNAVPGKPDSVPAASLLKAYRQELVRSHLEFKDYYFALLDRLSKSGSKDPFVLSALAQKAGSDGDLPTAIRYARRVIEQARRRTLTTCCSTVFWRAPAIRKRALMH